MSWHRKWNARTGCGLKKGLNSEAHGISHFRHESVAMQPIHELLSRIKWDETFGRAEFIIGYHDRFNNNIIRVPLKEILFDKEDRFDFELIDDMGVTHSIPLHRIREVYRDGVLIWHRDGAEQ